MSSAVGLFTLSPASFSSTFYAHLAHQAQGMPMPSHGQRAWDSRAQADYIVLKTNICGASCQ
jgi:hypothetical protein